MPTVEVAAGTLHYRESGDGLPIVFLRGYLMGANLWDAVIRLLDGEFRCIAPELPFGAHPTPMSPDADLTTAGVARMIADFLQALDLRDVVGFTKPALVVWAAGDKHFPVEHAKRLAGILPDARLELILGSRTWVMRDRPQRTAHLIGRFPRSTAASQTTRTHPPRSAHPLALEAANENA